MGVRSDATADELERTADLPSITSFTLMAWVNIRVDRNDFSAFMYFGDNTATFYYYLGTAGDGTTIDLYNGTDDVTGTNLTVGDWNHVTFTGAGTGAGDLLGYLNGVLDVTHSGNASVPAEHLIFSNSVLSEFFNGDIAAIKVWDGAVLSAEEILQEMEFFMPVRTNNLHAWWPVLSTTDDQTDYSGNGRDFTVNGTFADAENPPIQWRGKHSNIATITEVAATSLVIPRQYVSLPPLNVNLLR